jgi:hypothetical protein
MMALGGSLDGRASVAIPGSLLLEIVALNELKDL